MLQERRAETPIQEPRRHNTRLLTSNGTLELDGNAVYTGPLTGHRQEQDTSLRIDTQDTT